MSTDAYHLLTGERVWEQPWPSHDASMLAQETVELVVQVNGKLRGHIQVPANATREDIERIALESEAVRKFTDGQKIKKVIVVPGRLVNVVI